MSFDFLPRWKTYVAAIGLVGLTVYQLSVGDVSAALQSLMAALAALGVRHAIQRSEEAATFRHNEYVKLQLQLRKDLTNEV